jgi:hypothetical protein
MIENQGFKSARPSAQNPDWSSMKDRGINVIQTAKANEKA